MQLNRLVGRDAALEVELETRLYGDGRLDVFASVPIEKVPPEKLDEALTWAAQSKPRT